MSEDLPPVSAAHRAETISHLHLQAVLPTLAELPAVCPEASELLAAWNFPLCFSLLRGPAITLVPEASAGRLRAEPGKRNGGGLTLLFLTAAQLNRTFANQPAPPPLPLGRVWLAARLEPFFALSRLLQRYLQPTAEELASGGPGFRRAHLRLTLHVLVRAVGIVGRRDWLSRHALAHAPAGVLEVHAPALEAVAWVRWDGRSVIESGLGPAPLQAGTRPDAQLVFSDEAALADALHGKLDSMAAVGLGRIRVAGLVPLADALGMVMDRVETYLQP